VNLTLLKLIVTPALIGLASLAGRKWGHAISGWLVALPLTTGPIVFFLAVSHGPAFAAETAAGILTGDPEEAARYLETGFSFVAVGSDVGVLSQGTASLAANLKRLVAAHPAGQP